MNKTVDIITLGCSKNLVDSEQLMRRFEAIGYRVRYDAENPDAEVVIVNTCGFIEAAKDESIGMILQLADEKKKGKIAKLFVMGCLSERYRGELEKEIPEVDKFYGKFDYSKILLDLGHELRSDLRLERKLSTPSHYSYIKISEGCSRSCSYCAIPLITGKHRSRPMEDIENEVKNLAAVGVKEFNLIAQDLSMYGLDRYKSLRLADLVRRISDIQNVEWIRLHYAYPAQFPYDLLPVIKERKNVCKYLDIALQHISDRMLKLMRRNIDKAQTYSLIERIRAEVPGIHLRTTMLVGHPEETKKDIDELKKFIKFARFERLGTFAYSDEDGTFANKNYQDTVTQGEKQRRLNEIMDLQQTISAEINQEKTGKIFKTIIDRQEDDFYIGRTEFDSPEVDQEVLLQAKDKKLQTGKFYDVKITCSEDFDLYGTALDTIYS